VKNTFICVQEVEEAPFPSSRAVRGYHRAQSDGVVCPSYLQTHSSDLLIGNDSACTTELDSVKDEVSLAEEGKDSRIMEWTRSLELGGIEASLAIADIADHVATLAFEPLGCHVVQRALEVASPAEARCLAFRLHGSAVDAARSPFAHFVLEKIVHYLGTGDAAFIAQELHGCGRSVALNIYGCGVVCRLIEFSAQEPLVSALIDEVLTQDPATLCCHKFGHRVAMSIISNASDRQRNRIVSSLREGGLQRLARHRFAARVLEQVLTQGCSVEAQRLAAEFMSKAGSIVSLACHSFGVQVVRGILELPRESKVALQYLQKAIHKLRKDKYGAMLIEELGLQGGQEDGMGRAFAVGGA